MTNEFIEDTKTVLRNDGYLPAIKYLKDISGCGLVKAKEIVDTLRSEILPKFNSQVEILTERNKLLTEALEKISKLPNTILNIVKAKDIAIKALNQTK